MIIEIDLEPTILLQNPKYSEFELNLKDLRRSILKFCKDNEDDEKMKNCKNIILEFMDNHCGSFRNPTLVKIFNSKEEFDKMNRSTFYYFVTGCAILSYQVMIVRVYEKSSWTIQGFVSNEDAEAWIKENELKGQREHEAFLKSDKFSPNIFGEIPQRVPFKYDLKKYSKDWWVVECFQIGDVQKKLYFTEKEEFDREFFLWMRGESFNKFHYSIDVIGSNKTNDMKYLLELYSTESDFVINIFEEELELYEELSLLLLLHYNSFPINFTNDFLEYHLINTFKSDRRKFKSYLKDALLIWEDEMTFYPKHLTKLHDYIKDNLKDENSPIIAPEVNDSEDYDDDDEDKSDFIIDENDLYDFERGNSKLKKHQIRRSFTYLSNTLNGQKKPFLSEDDVKILQKIGLRLPISGNPQKVFTLNMNNKEKGIIYGFFYVLWQNNGDVTKRGIQKQYAEYIKTYFSNFATTQLESIKRRMDNSNAIAVRTIEEEYLKLKKEK